MPDLRFDLDETTSREPHPLAERLCGVASTAGDIGIGDGALLVSPGLPGSFGDPLAGGSVLYLRMAARDGVAGSAGAMPPIGSTRVDEQHGLPLLEEFIENLSCP
jgi:hypothetical protein